MWAAYGLNRQQVCVHSKYGYLKIPQPRETLVCAACAYIIVCFKQILLAYEYINRTDHNSACPPNSSAHNIVKHQSILFYMFSHCRA